MTFVLYIARLMWSRRRAAERKSDDVDAQWRHRLRHRLRHHRRQYAVKCCTDAVSIAVTLWRSCSCHRQACPQRQLLVFNLLNSLFFCFRPENCTPETVNFTNFGNILTHPVPVYPTSDSYEIFRVYGRYYTSFICLGLLW